MRSFPHHQAVALACAAAAAALLSNGCGTIKNARQAQDPALARPGERTPTAREMGLPTAGAVPLREFERVALVAHPAIVAAQHSAESAIARIHEVEGAYYPQVSVGPLRETLQTTNTTNPPSSNASRASTSAGFSLSWLIFDFGRTPAIVRQAAMSALSAQESARATVVNTLFSVRQSYFSLAAKRELLEVADESVRDFEVHLDQTRTLFDVGRRIQYDVTKAELDLGNARLTRIKAADALLTAQATLANTVGLAELTSWQAQSDTITASLPPTFAAAWKDALENEPRIAAARAVELGASALVDAQIAALYPSLSFSAGYSASGTLTNLPLIWNWSLGPSVSWLLFNGFTNYYSIDEAASNLRGARASRAETEQGVWLEVRTTWIGLQDARSRFDLTQLNVQYAEETLGQAQVLFEVGRSSSVELTDAQLALVQARADRVQARADLNTAQAQLWKAMGKGAWE